MQNIRRHITRCTVPEMHRERVLIASPGGDSSYYIRSMFRRELNYIFKEQVHKSTSEMIPWASVIAGIDFKRKLSIHKV